MEKSGEKFKCATRRCKQESVSFLATIYKFELSEALYVPIFKKRVATADATYSVLTKRTKERSAVVEGTACMFHLGVQTRSSRYSKLGFRQ